MPVPVRFPALAVQPDGGIVAVQASGTGSQLVRFDATGTPDGTTFDDVSAEIPDITTVAVQPPDLPLPYSGEGRGTCAAGRGGGL